MKRPVDEAGWAPGPNWVLKCTLKHAVNLLLNLL
jgi:hypothetical protein